MSKFWVPLNRGSQSWQRQESITSWWGCNAGAIRPILHFHQENGHFTGKPTLPMQSLSQPSQIDSACRLQPGKTPPQDIKHLPKGSSHLKAGCWVIMSGYPGNSDLFLPIAFNMLGTSNSCSEARMSRSYSNFLRDVQLWNFPVHFH